MTIPLQLVFKQMAPSQALEQEVRERVAKLERFHSKITACRVSIVPPGRKGDVFEIGVEITVPGGEIVATREPGKNQAHEDPYVAIRDAFNAAVRQLEDFTRIRRRQVKRHELPDHGYVVNLVHESPDDAYGFLETADALRVYFHRNAVSDGGFEGLSVGDEVRFVLAEGEGEDGPQASTVVPVSEARYPG
jgi:cold shock CspA family protein/ribosome-associated translation inhibitor RaiA